METEPMRCANGHKMADDDSFCGSCGAPAEALPNTDPEWATDGQPDAEISRCPSGHFNRPENQYCSTCGAQIPSSPTASGPAEPLTARERDLAHMRTATRWVLTGTAVVVLLIGLIVWWQARQPTDQEKWDAAQQQTADEQAALPHGVDAWDQVAKACSLDSNAVMTDYAEVNRSDFDAYYEYEDIIGEKHYATVDLNDYGAITWIDSCNHIDGAPDERVDIGW